MILGLALIRFGSCHATSRCTYDTISLRHHFERYRDQCQRVSFESLTSYQSIQRGHTVVPGRGRKTHPCSRRTANCAVLRPTAMIDDPVVCDHGVLSMCANVKAMAMFPGIWFVLPITLPHSQPVLQGSIHQLCSTSTT